MEIQFRKADVSHHELKVVRSDQTTESVVLDTATYLLHDVCHYFVETELKTIDGFWGMLSQGYTIHQVSGKTNPLTEKLRIIECVVGGTQSVYSSHMNTDSFWNYMETVDFKFTNKSFLETVVPRIRAFMLKWEHLPVGEILVLNFVETVKDSL